MLVKDNHPTLRQKIEIKIERSLASPTLFESTLHTAQTKQTGHARTEERRLVASGDVPPGYLDFPHVAQVFCLTRTTTHGSKEQQEMVYGLTSLPPEQASPERPVCLVRRHWHIENKRHYVRDVTFDENRSQVRTGSLPRVMAAIRNACIGLMRLAGHTNIAAATRRHAAQPRTALPLLGIQGVQKAE
jgi:predicted transposase YbfD/YdcC